MFGTLMSRLAASVVSATATSGTSTATPAPTIIPAPASSSASTTTAVDGCYFRDGVLNGWLGLVQRRARDGGDYLGHRLVFRMNVVGELAHLIKGIVIKFAVSDS